MGAVLIKSTDKYINIMKKLLSSALGVEQTLSFVEKLPTNIRFTGMLSRPLNKRK